MITLDQFEDILKAKYRNGVHTFTGNRTHNVYHIHNNGKTRGWTVWVNKTPIKINTNSFAVADEIYEREVRAFMK